MKKITIMFVLLICLVCFSVVADKDIQAFDTTHNVTLTNFVQNGVQIKHHGKNENVMIPSKYYERKYETRAAWVATVFNIDFKQNVTAEMYKTEYTKLLDTFEKYNLNTVFFQVRSMLDAFYPSEYNPYSQFIGMNQNELDKFDPLKYMVEETHNRGMEFHAWLNPYRVTNAAPAGNAEDFFRTLPEKSFIRKNPTMYLRSGNSVILNPAEPKVVEHIKDTALEIARNYEVDGINFDDYFYLNSLANTADAASYNLYKSSNPLSLPTGLNQDNWRRENVNKMIKEVSDGIKEVNQEKKRKFGVRFGVSPAGVWASSKNNPAGSPTNGGYESYTHLYADSRKWVIEGWLDYISPQIYWQAQNTSNPYCDMVDWWRNQIIIARNNGHEVQLNISAALYRYDGTGSDSWTAPSSEIADQLLYNTKYPNEVTGYTLFSYKNLNAPVSTKAVEAVNGIKARWQQKAIPSRPVSANKNTAALPTDVTLYQKGEKARFVIKEVDDNAYYYVMYKALKGTSVNFGHPENFFGAVRSKGNGNFVDIEAKLANMSNYDFYLRVMDCQGNESTAYKSDFIIKPNNAPGTTDLIVEGKGLIGETMRLSFAPSIDLDSDRLTYLIELAFDGENYRYAFTPDLVTGVYVFEWPVVNWPTGNARFRLTISDGDKTTIIYSSIFMINDEVGFQVNDYITNYIYYLLR